MNFVAFEGRTSGPDVVILGHYHAQQIMSVGINPSNQHIILFDEPEPCSIKGLRSNLWLPWAMRVDSHLVWSSEFQ